MLLKFQVDHEGSERAIGGKWNKKDKKKKDRKKEGRKE